MRLGGYECGEDVAGLGSGQLEIEGIGAKVEAARPFGDACFCETYLIEQTGCGPCTENASSGERRQIHDSALTIIVTQK